MPADYDDLLGMFAANNFADDVRAFDRTGGELILNIEMQANGLILREESFDLAFVFAVHGDDGNFDGHVKTEDAGVRQVHALRFKAKVAADYGHRAGLMQAFKKLRIFAEKTPEILLWLTLRNDVDDFAAESGGVFHFVFEIEKIGGGHLSIYASCGCGPGPAHGGDGQRAMQRREHRGLCAAACPALPQIPFFGADILQADGLHLVEAPVDRLLRFGSAGYAGTDVVAEFGEVFERRGVHGGVPGDLDEGSFGGVCGSRSLRRNSVCARGGEQADGKEGLAKGHSVDLQKVSVIG